MKTSRRAVAYAVTAVIGLLITAAVLANRSFLSLTESADILSALCDGFFVPGIFYLGIGLLVYVANDGFFDIFSYGGHSFLTLFTPFRKPENHQRYYDYKMARAERRQKPRPVLLRMGTLFLVLSGVCLALYLGV